MDKHIHIYTGGGLLAAGGRREVGSERGSRAAGRGRWVAGSGRWVAGGG